MKRKSYYLLLLTLIYWPFSYVGADIFTDITDGNIEGLKEFQKEDIFNFEKKGYNAALIAAAYGKTNALEWLKSNVESKEIFHKKTRKGGEIAHVAASNNKDEVLKWLHANEYNYLLNPERRNNHGINPLAMVSNTNNDAAKFLLTLRSYQYSKN